ncbi:hypothetical protein G6F61_001898 [Rhizopus arrhizus]|nr:hypothetical protein G6F61_001898 [Rhizopus arrhizus]
MSQSQKNYFTLTQQKPIKSGLLSRRQQQVGYLQPLELPSLPPLSQLLPTNNSNNNDKDSSKTKTDSTNNAAVEAAAAAAAAAAASVAGMIPASTNTFAPQPQMIYDYTMPQQTTTLHPGQFQLNPSSNPILVNNNPSTTADMVAAAAAAASMMSFDPMYAMPTQPGLTTDPVTIINPIEFNNQTINQRTRQSSNASNSSVEKVYSFVEIPGTNQKKRPRRRYDEIERLYHCNWPGCTKAYGTLNHLNAHVSMQKHGPKRNPAEFKEMRKEWRRQKKEREIQKKASEQQMIKQEMINQQYNSSSSPQQSTHHTFLTIPPDSLSVNGFY